MKLKLLFLRIPVLPLLVLFTNYNAIASNIIDKIFQPLFTSTPSDSATGLGVRLSDALVQAPGGALKVATNEGAGSLFIKQLPNV